MNRPHLAALKRECWAAFLVLSLLLAQFAGFQHRIEHAGWQSDPGVSRLHSGADSGKKSAAHSCVALDGATLADSIGAAPPVIVPVEASYSLAHPVFPLSWIAPLLLHFSTRAPPAHR